MAWLTAWLTKDLRRTLAPYIAGAALCGLLWAGWAAYVASWESAVSDAYDRGRADQRADQRLSDAARFREIIERYNDATSDPIDPVAADCLLREIAGPHAPAIGEGADCGDL